MKDLFLNDFSTLHTVNWGEIGPFSVFIYVSVVETDT